MFPDFGGKWEMECLNTEFRSAYPAVCGIRSEPEEKKKLSFCLCKWNFIVAHYLFKKNYNFVAWTSKRFTVPGISIALYYYSYIIIINCYNNILADQTPTPTRFIRNCEEVGLFQDLQSVNPFDEGFKRAMETKWVNKFLSVLFL